MSARIGESRGRPVSEPAEMFFQQFTDGVFRHVTHRGVFTYCDGPYQVLSARPNEPVPVIIGTCPGWSDLQRPFAVPRSEVERPLVSKVTPQLVLGTSHRASRS